MSERKRRRLTADCKARVALEGLGSIFENGSDKGDDHSSAVRGLHANPHRKKYRRKRWTCRLFRPEDATWLPV